MSNSKSPPPASDAPPLDQPFIIGWEEWLSLPALRLPAIKAKVDTGAKTSALHAFLIQPFTESGREQVRFGIHPIPGRDDIEVFCTSPLIDRRDVTSSNGDKETRYVITTPVSMGTRTWDIEVTLTNREGMAYRMLLGRQAIRDGMLVAPAASFRQPRLSHRLYGPATRAVSTQSPGSQTKYAENLPPRAVKFAAEPTAGLRIAVLTRQLNSGSNRRLADAARQHGHMIDLLDLATLNLSFVGDGSSVCTTTGLIGRYDCVLPRFVGGNGSFGAAVIRSLESAGSQVLNSGDALDLLRNPLALAQALAQVGARQIQGSVTEATWPDSLKANTKAVPDVSILTVGGRAIAGVALHDSGSTKELARADAIANFAQAERIVGTLALGLASVDFGSDGDGRIVVRISGSPRLGLFERVAGIRVADIIVLELEARAQLAVGVADVGHGED